MSTNEPDWATSIVNQIAAEVRRLRGSRSAREVADETARLGFPISQQVITRLENGRRGDHLEVSELLVLAAALGVPPIQLLFPDLPDGPVRYLPHLTIDSWSATKLFAGYEEAPEINNQEIDILRRHDDAMHRLERSYEAIQEAASEHLLPGIDDTPEMDRMRQQRDAMAQFQLRNSIDHIRRLRSDMRDIGMTPPKSSDFIDNEPESRGQP